MIHTFVLVMMLLNASTGEPQKIVALKTYDSLQECEQARFDMGPQHPVDGLATVFVCAVPPKQI